jgi:hypothetical protein
MAYRMRATSYRRFRSWPGSHGQCDWHAKKISNVKDKIYDILRLTSRSSGVKALYLAELALALSVVGVPLT